MSRHPAVLLSASLLLLAALSACPSRPVVTGPDNLQELGIVAGRVLKGPVKGASVTVYRLTGSTRGAVAGTATTDDAGAFRAGVGTATGPFLVVATGGTFADEASGVPVALNTAELTALVPAFELETKLESLLVSPVSHLAAGLALRWVDVEGKTLAAADAEAWQHLNSHFGGLDWHSVSPTDLTTAAGATLDEPARAGLLLAALSMESRLMAEAAGLTPGGRVNPLSLLQALYDDVTADGFFDGQGRNGQLVLPQGGAVSQTGPSATALDGQTARTALAQGVAKFLGSDRHVSRITLADAQQLIVALAGNTDSRIFRGTTTAADIEVPTVTWVKPAQDRAGVRGSVEIEVRAQDNVALKSFAFAAPASLVATAATPAADAKSSILRATLDVSSLPEGDVPLTVKAVDSANNEKSSTLTVVVSNRGPTITVTTPTDGSTVRGFAAISATAQPQAGAIAKLELRSPPPGVTPDSLPAADSFGATWNSLAAPDGLTTLTFHAEDTLGGTADVTVSVTVDNIPLGTVRATATLGAPVGGLSVKLVAIDAATGLPVLGRTGGSVLGETPTGSTTSPTTGAVAFTLTQENYEGPVQLVASGTSASYVDPTEPNTVIALPTTFTLTSYVRSYRAGDALELPLTGWTTLADDAALAYAQGKNPTSSRTIGLVEALAVTDPLFPLHLTRPSSWGLRTVYPVSLTTGSQSMRDTVFAALPDVGLNQLARNIALDVGLTPGTGYALPQLLAALRQDLSDGLFDGRSGSLQLVTPGAAPYALDANTTRFRLAIGIDQFVRGATNKTGLTRADLQTSGINDNVAGDTSLLYPAGAPVIPFDAQPPTVAWSFTFANGGQTGLTPVGVTRLVAGTVTVTADASDPTGVGSLAITVNGQPLAPAFGSTASHFVGAVDTKALDDGAITIAATVCDRLANCGPAATTITADNTAPIVTPAKPLAGYYSGAYDVDFSATDSAQLATFELVPPASAVGLVDADSALGHIYAAASSWSISTAADGAYPLSAKACDAVANCTTGTATVTLDRTPPLVTSPTILPQYTRAASVSVIAQLTDSGAGPRLAWAQQGVAPRVAGVCSQASKTQYCTFEVPLGGTGEQTIRVWGEDAATPTNIGATHPHSVTLTTFRDTKSPVPTFVAAPSYQDEAGMTVQVDPQTSRPLMPVQYVYAAGPVALPQTGGTARKIKSKLSDANAPAFRWSVPAAKPGSDSPEPTPTWTLSSVDGAAPPPGVTTSGSLRVAQVGDPMLYDLIVTGVPTGVLAYTVTFRDAAGNTATDTASLTYTHVAPPLVLLTDYAYLDFLTAHNHPDPANLARRAYSPARYKDLWSGPSRSWRVAVYNPNAEAVFLGSPSNSLTMTWAETWNENRDYSAQTGNISADGQTWGPSVWWYSDGPDLASIVAVTGHPAYECPGGAFQGEECEGVAEGFPCDTGTKPVHYMGVAGPGYIVCEDRAAHSVYAGGAQTFTRPLAPTAAYAAFASAGPMGVGGETVAATTTKYGAQTGWLLQPALTPNTASAIAIYSTISFPPRPSGGLPVNDLPVDTVDAAKVGFVAGMLYDEVPGSSQFAVASCRNWVCTAVAKYYNHLWQTYYFRRSMAYIDWTQTGSLSLIAAPCGSDGVCTTAGTAAGSLGTLSFNVADR